MSMASTVRGGSVLTIEHVTSHHFSSWLPVSKLLYTSLGISLKGEVEKKEVEIL